MRIAVTASLTTAALVCTSGSALAAPEVSAKDKAAIIKVINTADRNADSAKRCGALSSSLIKAMFGSKKQCLISQQGDSETPTSVKVSSISVSGNKAKAKLSERGGSESSGTWEFSRSGGTWHVSLMKADYFRSGLRVGFGPKYKSDGPETDPFDSKAYRACGLKALLERSDKKFLALIYESESSHNKVFGQVFSACSSKAPGGKSPFRKVFETVLKQEDDAQGIPADLTSCVITKLRSAVSEPTLINALMDGVGSTGYNKFGQTISTVSNACNKGGASGQVRAPKGIRAPHPIH
jgi:hypothetical protein